MKIRRKSKDGAAANIKARLDQLDDVVATIIESVNTWSKGIEARLAALEGGDAEQAEDGQEGDGEA